MRTTPATLWIGASLSALEHLCLASLVRAGMPPVLYAYAPVANVPDGVRLADARDILPEDAIWTNRERKSLAPFSDYFRYRMLATTPHVWVDADVLALRPFAPVMGYLAAMHPPVVAIGVLALPAASPSLARLIGAAEAPRIDLPWLARDRDALAPLADTDGTLRPEDLPYKALGPRALTWAMRHHGEMEHVLPAWTHYPLQPRQIMRPFRKCEPLIDWDQASSIHLFGSVQHAWFADQGTRVPPENSFLHEMYRRYGIDPTMR